MNDKQQAAEDFFHFANKLRGLMSFAEYVKTVGDLEQNEKELRSCIAIHEDKLKTLLKSEEDAIHGFKSTKQMTEGQVNDALIRAQQQKDNAKKEAQQILEIAESSANRFLDEAGKRKQAMDAEVISASKKLAETRADILVQENKLKALRDEMTQLVKKLG